MTARALDDERGAVLVLVTISMMVLLLLAGVVIDLGAVQTYRADQQSVSDAAASAGAAAAARGGNGQDACEAARQYVLSNSDRISGSLAGIDCLAFTASCQSSTPEATETTTSDGYTISITYPVHDSSPLMASDVMGAPAVPVAAEDGTPCDRFAVSISSDYATGFIRLAGYQTLPADVHTVAKSHIPEGEKIPINLLVLDRYGCETIQVGGSGSAGILVGEIFVTDIDEETPGDQPGLLPGLAAADSDASTGCGSGNGVIDIDGSNGRIRADGPPGCVTQTGTHDRNGLLVGEGCGQVRVVAPGPPGCIFPACSSANPSFPNPPPTSLRQRLTRAPADYLWNCKAAYDVIDPQIAWSTSPLTAANEQDIPGCTKTPAPHIDDLIRAVGDSGMPAGFSNRWTDSFSCNLSSSDPPIVVSGNWWIDCPSLAVNSTVSISGGNVVFDGSIDIRASGVLSVDNTGAPGWAFLRGGQIKKAGQGTLILRETAVYAARGSSVSMAGGSGSLVWIAPRSGDFEDLALWSDSSNVHSWSGQANLDMRGVFFTPWATADYSGGAGQNQVRAQFIADKLNASGNGALVVAPEFGRAVEFPVEPQSIIIR